MKTVDDKLASYSSIPYNTFCSLLIFLGNGDCLDNDNDSHDPTQLVIVLSELNCVSETPESARQIANSYEI